MSEERFAARRRGGLLQRWRLPLIIGGGVMLAGTIVWAIWFSGLLAANKVVVEGESTMTEAQIRTAADVPVGTPLLRVDTVAIESRVASMERVQDVSVSRSMPHTIRIKVTERVAVAYAKLGGEIRALDQYGIAYRTFDAAPKGLPEVRVTVADPRRRQQTLTAVASVVKAIRTAPLRADLRFISASSKDSIVLDLTKGRTVTWGSAGNAKRKLAVLSSLLQISAKQYDVSAPDQPTTRR